MKYKIKDKAQTVYRDVNTVFANTQQLVMAIALVVCATYNAWTLQNAVVSKFEYYSRLGASVIVACTAAYAYYHHAKQPRS